MHTRGIKNRDVVYEVILNQCIEKASNEVKSAMKN